MWILSPKRACWEEVGYSKQLITSPESTLVTSGPISISCSKPSCGCGLFFIIDTFRVFFAQVTLQVGQVKKVTFVEIGMTENDLWVELAIESYTKTTKKK